MKLERLHEGVGRIPKHQCQTLADAAAVCLHHHGHVRPVTLSVEGDTEDVCDMEWDEPTADAIGSHADMQDATENGALAMAFLTVTERTDYTIIRQSPKTTGVDWIAARKGRLFQDAARLEVSGILEGEDTAFRARIRSKLRQTDASDLTGHDAMVSVTEFGRPRTALVTKPRETFATES